MAFTTTTPSLERMISDALERHVRESFEQEIAAAQVRLGETLRKSTAQVVMTVMAQFEVERNGTSIMIRVKNA